MMYCVRVKVQKGTSRHNFPRFWKEVEANTYTFYTKFGSETVSTLLARKEVADVLLFNLVSGDISVYSSKHAEQIRSATTQINVTYVNQQPEKLSWLRLLFSTKKPKT